MDIIRHDWRFFWPESITSFITAPSAWDSSLNTGIGMSSAHTLWITTYLNISAFFGDILHLNWFWTSLVFWILPILVIGFLSSYSLFRYCFPNKKHGSLLASLLYIFNTYFLLIFSGGQLGFCFAYVILPFVILTFIRFFENTNVRNSLIFGLVLSVETLFDIRLALLSIGAVVLYSILTWQWSLRKVILGFILPFVVLLGLHAYWILPLIMYPSASVTEGLATLSAVEFFSFAQFENSFSLLHPNWPENIFGKVSFMRAEFLLIPIIAFSSLFFLKKKEYRQNLFIIYFSLLGLIGAFLGKGINAPFASLYMFLFDQIPGFSLFRDSTKFFVFVVLSYSILIPFVLSEFISLVSRKKIFNKGQLRKRMLVLGVFGSFIILWMFLLKDAVLVNSSFFEIKKAPQEYAKLSQFITNQNEWFRTLWIPQWQRYGFFSNKNPAIGRAEIFKNSSSSAILSELKNKQMQLDNLGVKYVIVPFDSEGEIFLEDYKYNEKEYRKIIESLKKEQWLQQIKPIEKIQIFENKNYKDRFYIQNNPQSNISFQPLNSTEYYISLYKVNKNDVVVFSENFNPNWVLHIGNTKVPSKNKDGLNTFILPVGGTFEATVEYIPQRLVNAGLLISFITFMAIIFYLIRDKMKWK